MPNSDPDYLDLYDICPAETEFEYGPGYAKHEREVLTPLLQKLGYEVGAWSTGESDSFGVLSRCVALTKDGVTKIGVYA